MGVAATRLIGVGWGQPGGGDVDEEVVGVSANAGADGSHGGQEELRMIGRYCPTFGDDGRYTVRFLVCWLYKELVRRVPRKKEEIVFASRIPSRPLRLGGLGAWSLGGLVPWSIGDLVTWGLGEPRTW